MWNTLGIEPTNDLKVIKKAYAQKAKLCSPEDDPEGFQTLRDAYEFSQRYAKSDQVKPSNIETSHSHEDGEYCEQYEGSDEHKRIYNKVAQLDSSSPLEEWQNITNLRKSLTLEDCPSSKH